MSSTASANLVGCFRDKQMEPILKLVTSSQLQGQTLDSLLVFFRKLVEKKLLEFKELFDVMEKRLEDDTHKVGVYNLSKCMSTVVTCASKTERNKTLDDILGLLSDGQTPEEPHKHRCVLLAILMTGDIGRSIDLAEIEQSVEKLKIVYEEYIKSSSEDLKSGVAYALGNASVGSPSCFLPSIVSQLGDCSKNRQFLQLSALREFIKCNAKAGTDMTAYMETMLPPLEELCSDKEEGVRSLVAECLGSLAVLHPDVVLPKLAALYDTHSMITVSDGSLNAEDEASIRNANICCSISTAVKHAISGKVDEAKLSAFMPKFVELVQQEELRVRNAALLMLYSAFHHMPNIVAELARESIMPYLYNVAELKAERKVDLGPFTHTVDEALPLRKSALSILSTCLERNQDILDMPSLMRVLARSLADKEDIQLHAHHIITSMATRHQYHLSASLDLFVEPLEKTMNKKAGNKTGTELERLNDWIKSSLRVMLALSAMDGAKNSAKFMDLVQRVKGNSKFASHLASLEDEK